MQRRPRKILLILILRAVALLFLGAFVALCIAASQIDLETLRKTVVNTLSSATGMPVEIRGDISWRVSLRPRVRLSDVRIANAPWAKTSDFAHADSISATLDIMSIFDGRPSVRELRARNLIIDVEQNADGVWSIPITKSVQPGETPGQSDSDPEKYPFNPDFGLSGLDLRNPKFIIITPTQKRTETFDHIRVRYDDDNDAATYSGSLTRNGESIDYVASFSEFDAKRHVYPVRIATAIGMQPIVINAALEGTSKIPISFNIDGTVSDIDAFGRFVGFTAPQNLPSVKFSISGGFDHSKLNITKSSFVAGANNIGISGNVSWADTTPKINVKISSSELNIIDLFPTLYTPSGWVHPNRALNVFHDVPLFAPYLHAINGDIKISLKKLRVYRDLTIDASDITANINDGVMDFTANNKIAGGTVTVDVDAAEYNGDLIVRAGGRGANVGVGTLMTELREDKVLTGLPADFKFYFESRGGDLSKLMANVTGQIVVQSVDTGRALSDITGYLYGGDFITAMRHDVEDVFAGNKDKTDNMKINCAVANLKLRNGRMETERGVAMESAEVNIRATGFVDLGKEQLEASMVATPVRGIKISASSNVINSVKVSGNMAEPDVSADGDAIVGRAAAIAGAGLILAPFTGGLSLAAGAGIGFLASDLLGNWLADPHPCATALRDGAPTEDDDPDILTRPIDELIDSLQKAE